MSLYQEQDAAINGADFKPVAAPHKPVRVSLVSITPKAPEVIVPKTKPDGQYSNLPSPKDRKTFY